MRSIGMAGSVAILLAMAAGSAGTALAIPSPSASPRAASRTLAPPAESAQALDILKRGVGFRTVAGQGQVPAYAAYLAGVLEAGGFARSDITIEPQGETATLTAVYHGREAGKPLVLLGHMDVVEAKAADWGRDPFTATEENGYLFGRGVYDDKFDLSMIIATLVRLKREGFVPKRDIVLLLSGDEETAQHTAEALAPRYRDAYMVLNGDSGGGQLDADGRPLIYDLQAAEKTYADFEISTTNPGGHSSAPGATNAIADLARIIDRIHAYHFPVQSNEITRASFRATAARTPGELGAAMKRFADDPGDAAAAERISREPEYVGQVRTTCVPTMLRGGHALNALPQSATVSINCRIFPGTPVEEVQATLLKVAGDPGAKIRLVVPAFLSGPSPLRPDIMAAIRKAIDVRYPGLPITPVQESGASDSLFFRNLGVPSYGVSGMFMKSGDQFAHGLNERIPLAAIDGALAQWHVLLTELSR